jgi:hypothetical protein
VIADIGDDAGCVWLSSIQNAPQNLQVTLSYFPSDPVLASSYSHVDRIVHEPHTKALPPILYHSLLPLEALSAFAHFSDGHIESRQLLLVDLHNVQNGWFCIALIFMFSGVTTRQAAQNN